VKLDSWFEKPETWKPERYLANENEMKRFTATASLVPGDAESVLDVGTGNGAFLRILEQNRKMRLQGMDYSPTAVASRICATGVAKGSITEIEFPDRSFDLVSALEVIEHLNCTMFPTAMQELQRVAARYILISVPYKSAIFDMCRCPFCESVFQVYGHLQRFDEARMANLFTDFEMQTHKVVMTRAKYPIRNPLRRRRVSPMPPTTQCPFCEYRTHAPRSEAAPSKASLKSKIQRLIPERDIPTWNIGLYRRKP
jgi:cyclopropane fatty-acyl-phospholipid synthase-like methyltransferase